MTLNRVQKSKKVPASIMNAKATVTGQVNRPIRLLFLSLAILEPTFLCLTAARLCGDAPLQLSRRIYYLQKNIHPRVQTSFQYLGFLPRSWEYRERLATETLCFKEKGRWFELGSGSQKSVHIRVRIFTFFLFIIHSSLEFLCRFLESNK